MHRQPIRRFFCGNCDQEVYICSHCDRGNIYCGKTCSKFQRQKKHRESNRRSRKHPLCKKKAAQRQQRYRKNLEKRKLKNSAIKLKVTEQGTPKTRDHSIMTSKSINCNLKLNNKGKTRSALRTSEHPISRLKRLLSREVGTYCCSFCKCKCSQSVRYESLISWKRSLVPG